MPFRTPQPLRSPAFHRYFFIAFAALCAFVLYRYVDLTPKVERNFFFSSDDPQLKTDKEIDELFVKNSQLIISVAASDIHSEEYAERIQRLGQELKGLPDVTSVQAIGHGPDDVEDALESPLWRRLLIPDDRRSTNLIVTLRRVDYGPVVTQVERLVARYEGPDFRIDVSGVPFVVVQIQRNAMRDLKVFTIASFAVFTVLIALIYRSIPILVGTLVACLTAAMLALIVQYFLRLEPGVLIANVGTIVFVMALSHIVFMTANWRLAARDPQAGDDLVREAELRTGPASFWAMATTLLGFLSFLLASAKPLRQFGLCVSVGTLIAIACAYVIYPAFLRAAPVAPRQQRAVRAEGWMRRQLRRRHAWVTVAFAALFVWGVLGLPKINKDPSLLSTFKEDSELRRSLARIDQRGGSSPLEIVVRDRDGMKLSDKDAFARLRALHRDIERDPEVGTAISLPVLMAEAERNPFSFLFSRERILKRLEQPKYERVATQFITHDRQYARFILRMQEEGRTEPREVVIDRLHAKVRRHGFTPVLTGRLYILQSKMAGLLAASVISGMVGLTVLFWFIALWISRSVKVSTVILVFLVGVVVCLLGAAGQLGIPPDVISAPAASVAIAMGIDNAIHLMYRVRRARGANGSEWSAWVRARQDLWPPIVASCFVVSTGFSIFLLSTFPPTQRLGFFITLGTLLTLLLVLLVVPVLATLRLGTQRRQQEVSAD